MAGKTFRCRLVTPTAGLLDEAVAYASVPAWDGLFGVLPGRAPILARLGVGELRVDFADTSKSAGGSKSFLVDGGFAQMKGDELTILAEVAQPAEALTESESKAELAALESRTVPPDAPDRGAQVKSLERERARARMKVHLASRRAGI